MARKYYTLCKWDTDHNGWFDTFGSYSRAEVKSEMDWERDNGTKAKHLAIIASDDTSAAMIKAREALAAPK